MRPKSYQEHALAQLSEYLDVLKGEQQPAAGITAAADADHPQQGCCERAWRRLGDRGVLPGSVRRDGRWLAPPWVKRRDARGEAIPHICFKIPTGGGKTWLGVAAVERIQMHYLRRNTGLVLWVVPTRAIYAQTLQKFQNRTHPYYQILARSAAGRVKVLQKHQPFTQLDIQHHLCIMVLMLQSTNRTSPVTLKVFQDSGHFMDVFPDPMDAARQAQVHRERPDLDVHRDLVALGGTAGVVIKHSLGNALRLVRPLVVVDEGHRAYSQLARRTLSSLSPRFVLELSATPNHRAHMSNVLVDVSGSQLQAAQMIKLPIHLRASVDEDWRRTVDLAWAKLQELAHHAGQYEAKTRRYIRPIMLIQVERTGSEQRRTGMVHSEDVRAYLESGLGVPAAAIRVKTATHDELKDEDLLSELSPVRCIITKHALQEGWDCSFAYILTLLAGTNSKLGLTQLLGRILRQPYAKRTDEPALDASYVFCCNRKVAEVVAGIHRGLRRQGLADLADAEVAGPGALITVDDDGPRRHSPAAPPAQSLSCDVQLWHRSSSGWRPLIWGEDLLKELLPLQLSPQELAEFARRQGTALLRGGGRSKLSGSADRVLASADRVAMVAQLSSKGVNPFVAAQMIMQVMRQLRAAGMSQQQMEHTRWQWFQALKQLVALRLTAAQARLFEQKLVAGCLRVKLNLVMNLVHDTPLPLAGWLARMRAIPWAEYDQTVAWYDESELAMKWWYALATAAPMNSPDEARLSVYPDGWLARHAQPSDRKQVVYTSASERQPPPCLGSGRAQHDSWINVGQVKVSWSAQPAVAFKLMLPRPGSSSS